MRENQPSQHDHHLQEVEARQTIDAMQQIRDCPHRDPEKVRNHVFWATGVTLPLDTIKNVLRRIPRRDDLYATDQIADTVCQFQRERIFSQNLSRQKGDSPNPKTFLYKLIENRSSV